MAATLAAERIVLGVGGGIAAYKAAELVRRLREQGHEVQVVMSEAATRFVTPLTFQALSGRPVRTTLWDDAAEAAMGHIELARWAQRVVVAPATADLIARMATGQADDLLTTLLLATGAGVLLAPAMNQQMWAHPAVQANLALLRERGVQVVGPGSGGQACGEFGPGRMSEPAEILAALGAARGAGAGVLQGRRVLITAGPTLEDIDPVRFVGNRSSGKMGFAVAAAARAAGAEVTLVSGPVSLPTPDGVTRIDVRSAQQMHQAVFAALPGQDVFIAAAAVADYRPAEPLAQKRKKAGETWQIDLVLNPDILAEVAARPQRPFIVGFAAETNDVEAHARDKLRRKRLDMIAANHVGQPGCGFESCDNALSVYWQDGGEEIALADKSAVAAQLVECIARRMEAAG
ncbi:bifunctional phosphopantothenoylcysteine decarboxylase/phosphopantothenate--cysteine ligase CoaBC [Pseudomarimonas salicorniae]|uniref:Coenzyme A biosynthesis bifunctional protein CoaBC n=1 Tax=Pseudomarimonas salicorniae TaxID=2933270 RepID=A0ABT0GDB1_9GAMM|nr:bifunctional phosphopantothenoylcysteine decarboxylase/phosphopantothenate--cysteine ligase CoaBC [Lysobacter sp. CAU 1642]MCK7592536.1 bifunctional phosphopantothenoylcysteine decarboxylase/phosphopantothenate--cysteine ligase CoaBC [Lysobacter sp. CAU 1642]